jgi:hypothetical protein
MNAVMDVINVLVVDLSMPVDLHTEACKDMVDPNLAKIVLKMMDAVRCH